MNIVDRFKRLLLGALPAFVMLTGTLMILRPLPAIAQIRSLLVASNLQHPVLVASPPGDSRLFIVEQRGVIKILKNGTVLGTPFLDIHSRVLSGGLQGMLGLAFDPNYAQNGAFYVNFTDLSGNSQVEGYRASSNPDVAEPTSRVTVLSINQPVGEHNGGSMAFGPLDGYLYIGMGDSGPNGDPSNYAQDPGLLLGKILRIDVDHGLPYRIPPDNPFVGVSGYRGEIWALGLRNPWGVSFDSQSGDLWTADVGESAWEEIDFQPASSHGGENYGWRRMEGTHCYNPPSDCNDGTLTLPIYEFAHDAGRCAIQGGRLYRGPAIPFLDGSYFFGDFCTSRIWSLRYDGSQVSGLTEWTSQLQPPAGESIDVIVGICAGPNGEIYIVDRGRGGADGEVYRIVIDLQSAAPLADRGTSWHLDPIFPNPSTGIVRGSIHLTVPSHLEIDVLDVGGRRVRSLLAGRFPAGDLPFSWNGRDARSEALSPGIYFVRARGECGIDSRRVMLLH
jgi:glucose/arabinose dehydrogenase